MLSDCPNAFVGEKKHISMKFLPFLSCTPWTNDDKESIMYFCVCAFWGDHITDSLLP